MNDTVALPAPEVKKASHQAIVLLIGSRAARLYPHPDPATTELELVGINTDSDAADNDDYGYQAVVKKGQFKDGDLAVYIQPDSVVPQTEPFQFIWEGHVGLDGTVPERRRRITVRKFRKEWSEGLLLPVTDFPEFTGMSYFPEGLLLGALVHGEAVGISVGSDVSDLLGITHYDPDAGTEGTHAPSGNAPKRKFRYPRTLRGWFNFLKRLILNKGRLKEATVDVPVHVPTYDVDALKNYANAFVDGEEIVLTEKIHGSNGRFLYLDGIQYAGSRNQWKAPGSNSTWHKALDQNQWIGDWCRQNEGSVLWGEVVPTQDGYNYGAKAGEVLFFTFDVYRPDGTWMDYDEYYHSTEYCQRVPLLFKGPWSKELLSHADGASWVKGAGHIREGFVAKTAKERKQRGLGRVQLKVVSNIFLDKANKR